MNKLFFGAGYYMRELRAEQFLGPALCAFQQFRCGQVFFSLSGPFELLDCGGDCVEQAVIHILIVHRDSPFFLRLCHYIKYAALQSFVTAREQTRAPVDSKDITSQRRRSNSSITTVRCDPQRIQIRGETAVKENMAYAVQSRREV